MPDPEESGGGSLEALNRFVRAGAANWTFGISPAGLALAFADWALHLAAAPGKQIELAQKIERKFASFAALVAFDRPWAPAPTVIEPLPADMRFRDQAWRAWPFDLYYQAFLLVQQWLHVASDDVPGARRHSLDVVHFAFRQLLDVWSPSNFPATNPEIVTDAWRSGGGNFARGAANLLADLAASAAPPRRSENFVPGRDVAITPGRVVFRNRLIELIRYAPATAEVWDTPILIVPAWIMKYYILDLSPGNSLIRHLVAQGRTVYAISWHNPDEADRNLSMEDYRRLGAMAAIDAISAAHPDSRIDALGYCLGGTLTTIVAAAMARDGDTRLRSLALLAAQTDFSEPGELALFIGESQIDFIEAMMWRNGYLDTRQMSGAFQILRSNDLIWSRIVRRYLLGDAEAPTDLMAWNADATRMPYRMHAEYLRGLFLRNDLAGGRYLVEGRSVALSDIAIPVFAVGTERDHVAPWRSVYKIALFAGGDVTFALTSGGHNLGIVDPPGTPGRRFRIGVLRAGQPYVDPDRWLAEAEMREGSWWAALDTWLAAQGGGRGKPPKMPDGLAPAPGTYVHEV